MAHLIEVAFRGNRKEFFQWDGDTPPSLRAGVIVDADRGEDFGRVHSTGELAEIRCKGCAHGCGTTPPPRKALRLATADDATRDAELTLENEQARTRAMERVRANNLVMKLTDAEWQWDRRKLTFYFTAERRVDFRALVRDLAAMFRARIELKQIGVRDEAKRLSGIGRCGREYCSASWLPDLRPVNLGVAKDQKLSLNPQQISGACGRLMCCLRYEHEFYVQSRRRFPKEGRILVTSVGEEKVITCDIFNDRVTLRSSEGDTRVVPLAELREEVGGFGDSAASERVSTAGDRDDELDEEGMLREDSRSRSTTSRPPASRPASRPTASRPAPSRPAPIRATSVQEPIDASAGASESVAPATSSAPTEASTASTSAPSADAATSSAPVAPRVPIVVASAGAINGGATTGATTDATSDTTSDETTDATTEGAPRRKRRRGRRGGRRLRAAEQRREQQEAGGDLVDGQDDDTDDNDQDESPDRSSDTPSDSPPRA